VSSTLAILRSTNIESCPFQAGNCHRSRQASVAGIVEDHLQGFPSTLRVNKMVIPMELSHFFNESAITCCAMWIGHLDVLLIIKGTSITGYILTTHHVWSHLSFTLVGMSNTSRKARKEHMKGYILHSNTKGVLLKTYLNG
jgi:hypothetical protein